MPLSVPISLGPPRGGAQLGPIRGLPRPRGAEARRMTRCNVLVAAAGGGRAAHRLPAAARLQVGRVAPLLGQLALRRGRHAAAPTRRSHLRARCSVLARSRQTCTFLLSLPGLGKRLKKTRKYDIITTPAERVEMAPLNEEDDEDEDATVFDIKYRCVLKIEASSWAVSGTMVQP
ncbi:membrane protein FAM174B [Cricetulus griseus]|uniref:membrane protein FAM174B n=1 Tax=Cricetulus griseus TaxID=10029 RepID=UPI0007DAA665|nr:membrane protein FAM174B [Cricetulus griseus]